MSICAFSQLRGEWEKAGNVTKCVRENLQMGFYAFEAYFGRERNDFKSILIQWRIVVKPLQSNTIEKPQPFSDFNLSMSHNNTFAT